MRAVYASSTLPRNEFVVEAVLREIAGLQWLNPLILTVVAAVW